MSGTVVFRAFGADIVEEAYEEVEVLGCHSQGKCSLVLTSDAIAAQKFDG